MPVDPCMFCQEHPCVCTGRKKSGHKGKLAHTIQPPVAKTEASKPAPAPVAPKFRAAPVLGKTNSVDPEVVEVVQILDYFGMLHPTEKEKYNSYLAKKPTTGSLISGDEEKVLTEPKGREGGDTEHENNA